MAVQIDPYVLCLFSLGTESHQKLGTIVKKVNNMKLQNTVMQLRKVCSHPFLFDWPLDSETQQPVVSDELVSASGKMMILDRLLDELFRRKHKVLLFSQFTTMLDIIEVKFCVFALRKTRVEEYSRIGHSSSRAGLSVALMGLPPWQTDERKSRDFKPVAKPPMLLVSFSLALERGVLVSTWLQLTR